MVERFGEETSEECVIKDRLSEMGIEVVLFDFDDTLISTHVIFKEYIRMFCDQIAVALRRDREEIFDLVYELNTQAFYTRSVRRDRWDWLGAALVEKLGAEHREVVQEASRVLGDIYNIIPQKKDGSDELLNNLKKCGIRTGLVTHANVEWTYFKLDELGFGDSFERVVIIDETGYKTSETWAGAISEFGVSPMQVMVIGDSVRSDIVPAYEAGVRNLVWVDEASGWELAREGKIPEEAIVISEIGELMDKLLE